MDTPDPVAIIKFQMEQQGLTRKDLEPMIGSRAPIANGDDFTRTDVAAAS